jgi:hypothetical protein
MCCVLFDLAAALNRWMMYFGSAACLHTVRRWERERLRHLAYLEELMESRG